MVISYIEPKNHLPIDKPYHTLYAMNYRHLYHAGNFADVFKHAILTALLEQLSTKNKPFCYIDSHAGIGLYDLNSAEAQRSLEYQSGIQILLNSKTYPPELDTYIRIVKSYQDQGNHYPGSPLIAAHFIGEHNQLILNERHDADFITLKKSMRYFQLTHCHHRCAYEFLPAILPPTPKRALILIDPPYESTNEFNDLIATLNKCLKRFATGIYAIWYPMVDKHDHHTKWLQAIDKLNIPYNHYTITRNKPTGALYGCGMIILNPPWQSDSILVKISSYLNTLYN